MVEVACRDEKEAQHIASTIIRERLAACANIIPSITSFFYWDKKLTAEHETLLLLKTTEAKHARLEKRIKQLHSYKVPGVIAWKAARVSREYEKWAKKELGRK